VLGIFEIGFGELFARGWSRTAILLILAFQVARITGMSHQRLDITSCFIFIFGCIEEGLNPDIYTCRPSTLLLSYTPVPQDLLPLKVMKS
jgi:hypothetical protein